MTVDAIALCREQPDVHAVLDALLAAGSELSVRPIDRGGLVQLYDDGGAPLVTIEGPSLVQVPGEVERLLETAVPTPVWRVEVRARAHHRGALGIAARLTDALVVAAGGVAWPPR